MKRRLARDLMGRWAWDLFALGFGEAHCVAHQCWHLHDARHPRHDPALVRELGDPLLRVYRALDHALAELLATAGPESNVLVLFSHGVGPHYDGDHLLDRALERIERKLPHGRALTLGERVSYLVRARDRAKPPVAGWLRRWPERAFRKSFRIPNNEAYAGIRINLAGREPHGRIRPAELDAYCEALTAELLALRHGTTGGPAFREVERCDRLYDGPRLALLPDLLAEWTREAEFTALASPTIGRIEGRYAGVRTGDHRPQGLVLATGPETAPGPLRAPVSILDLGPTIAARLGVELEGVDGQPVSGLLAGTG
jgi:predicted AlkP superfamily phosphohydrolase/phosphomutase